MLRVPRPFTRARVRALGGALRGRRSRRRSGYRAFPSPYPNPESLNPKPGTENIFGRWSSGSLPYTRYPKSASRNPKPGRRYREFYYSRAGAVSPLEPMPGIRNPNPETGNPKHGPACERWVVRCEGVEVAGAAGLSPITYIYGLSPPVYVCIRLDASYIRWMPPIFGPRASAGWCAARASKSRAPQVSPRYSTRYPKPETRNRERDLQTFIAATLLLSLP